MKLMIRAHDLGVKGEENIVARLNEYGLDGVQLVAYKSIDGIAYDKGGITKPRAEKIGARLREAGAEVCLIGAYFNPVHPSREKIEKGIAVFEDYIDCAAELGCDTVGSETGSYMGEPWVYHPDNRTPEALARVTEVFSRLADLAAQRGVNIAMEGAFGHVCYSPECLFEVISRINKPNVKVIFDLYNYVDKSNLDDMYGILERGIRLLGDKILLYHIKDFTTDGTVLKQCGVGRGVVDFDRVVSLIASQNKNATLVLEGTTGEDIPLAVSLLSEKIRKYS